MFDTMTMTKILGALCGTLLIFLLGNWAAEELYKTEPGGHGEEHAAGYVIEVADSGADEAASDEPEVPFAEVLASASVEDGEKVFKKCSSCHKIDGSNATGPYLDGIFGRDIASVDGYNYSSDLAAAPGDWNVDELNAFLLSPKGFAANTKMTFKGLPKVQDRANLVAYLESLGG